MNASAAGYQNVPNPGVSHSYENDAMGTTTAERAAGENDDVGSEVEEEEGSEAPSTRGEYEKLRRVGYENTRR